MLVSKVRPSPDQPDDDPCIERDPVYTTNLDGSKVDTGLFSGLSGKGWSVGLGLRCCRRSSRWGC